MRCSHKGQGARQDRPASGRNLTKFVSQLGAKLFKLDILSQADRGLVSGKIIRIKYYIKKKGIVISNFFILRNNGVAVRFFWITLQNSGINVWKFQCPLVANLIYLYNNNGSVASFWMVTLFGYTVCFYHQCLKR